MWSERIELEAELISKAPLVVGTGQIDKFDRWSSSREQETSEYSLVTADKTGRPVIPGSTIKGVLRAIAEQIDFDCDDLFGALKDQKGSDVSKGGRVVFRAARLLSDHMPPRGVRSDLPNRSSCDGKEPMHKAGLSVAARTAIDLGTGVAEDRKLFHEQRVEPGARFRLSLLVLTGAFDRERAIADTLRLLAPLKYSDEVRFGSGTTYGHGTVVLSDKPIVATLRSIDPETGDFSETDISKEFDVPPPQADAFIVQSAVLDLVASGPFIVIDSSENGESSERRRDGGNPQIVPLENSADATALMPGESLHGVLRRASAWCDALNGIGSDDDRSDPLNRKDHEAAAKLSPTQRLFGRNGFKGLLRIGTVEPIDAANAKVLTSVKLDRFSAGPIDNGLFDTKTFINTRFRVSLELVDRGTGIVTEADRNAFSDLIEYVINYGIEVGHGAGKGFGWFDVTRTDDEVAS